MKLLLESSVVCISDIMSLMGIRKQRFCGGKVHLACRNIFWLCRQFGRSSVACLQRKGMGSEVDPANQGPVSFTVQPPGTLRWS